MLVLLLVALLAFPTGSVFAQELPAPFCGQLSEADCDILVMSQEAQLDATSYTSSVDATTTIVGIPGLPAEELVFSWVQDTVIHMDPEIMRRMVELQTQGAEAMMENFEELMELTVELYRTLGVDVMINFTMPAEIADTLAMQSGVDVPEELDFHVILKDGFGYISTEGLEFIDPSLPEMADWIGIDLAGMVEMGVAQSTASQDPAQREAMMQSMAFSSMFSSDEVRDLLEDFVLVERLDDDEVGGTEVAVFETGFDFAGFLASPGFWTLVEENLDTINAMSDTDLTAQELQQARMAITFLGPALLQGLQLSSTASIGLDNYYPYAQMVDFSWDLSDLLSFAATTGALPPGSPTRALISLEIDATSADFDNAPEIEAPEDALVIPLEAMGVQ
ncbi:MAG: hypothetical protein DCC55_09175 [Chloroflexi bacterium]|nr:MAG: hypothetical protein DCC55_09175 [Chloroflexota bacterium]